MDRIQIWNTALNYPLLRSHRDEEMCTGYLEFSGDRGPNIYKDSQPYRVNVVFTGVS